VLFDIIPAPFFEKFIYSKSQNLYSASSLASTAPLGADKCLLGTKGDACRYSVLSKKISKVIQSLND
jgi:hypothetical protein